MKNNIKEIMKTYKEVSAWDIKPSPHIIIDGITMDLRKPKDRILARKLWKITQKK